jgi:beta-mannosidase
LKKLLSFLTILSFTLSFSQVIKRPLDQGWKFISIIDSHAPMPAKVPGNVFTDLYDNGKIPHPFVGDNEKDLQWISKRDWIYETEFEVSSEELKHANTTLVFEGLDTYANVFLNGKLILEANNAFRTWNIDVKKYLKKSNSLEIIFKSPFKIEETKANNNPYQLPEGNRIYTRKAQFQYGWDWGPNYNTMGIWRPVYLEFWDKSKLEDVFLYQDALTDQMANLGFQLTLQQDREQEISIETYINQELKASQTRKYPKGRHLVNYPVKIYNPKRWWTHNLGEPYLYEIKVQIKDSKGNLLDEKVFKKGLRTIELVTEKDEIGESFYFKLNGVPVYMKGANYIPQNSFQNWVKKEDYDRLLLDTNRANMNMLRVWGGGIYEEDYFYEKCDELGILVWQDFMFACAMYPGDEEFLKNVQEEAIDNVKRLRNHTSIALWCGNNESKEGWNRWGWQEGRSDKEKLAIWTDYQKLFNGILPAIIKEYTETPYWESSPKFGRGDARYISQGDAHDWWIWHDGHPFENLETKTPRFMSEFGFQGFPSLETMQFMQGKEELDFNSPEFKNHQKHRTGFETIKTYMERDFPVPTHEEDYAYVSQLVQAYGIGKGIEAQRRNKPKTMGSLYWQLNDVWPAVSWSSIDYFGNWKAMHYKAKESFNNLLVSFERKGNELQVHLVNDLLEPKTSKLRLSLQDIDGNVLKNWEEDITVHANSSSLVYTIDVSEFESRKNEIFIHGKFSDAENIYYFVSPKEMKLKEAPIKELVYDTADGSGYILMLTSPSLQRFVEIQSDYPGYWSNNYFDILPNKNYILFVATKDIITWDKPLKYKTLNQVKNRMEDGK